MKTIANTESKVQAVKASSLKEATQEPKVSAREVYRQKMAETKQAFENVSNEIRAELGTKSVTLKNGDVKIVEPSKTLVRAKANIEYLSAIEVRSLSESKRLLSSISKVDKMSASRVYEYAFNVLNGLVGGSNAVQMQTVAQELLGTSETSKFPTFKTFSAELPVKFAYSEADGWNVLAKLNKSAQLADKIDRQNKATAKK